MAANNNFEMKVQLERALALNSQMQSQLGTMRGKIERLLSDVNDSYEANILLLKEAVLKTKRDGIGIKGAYLKGGTFYLKGNMFFKDISCRNCPNNEDYERRRRENEMFPMDIYVKARHVWSNKDKQGIILGIKEQIIDYLKQTKRYGKKSKQADNEKLAKLLNMVPDDFRIDWDFISGSNLLHRHSAQNCEAIWNLFLHPSLNRSAWSEKENLKLLEAAKKYNFQNWQAIAAEVGQRSDFQCFVHYKNNVCHMLPETYTKWSKEDDKRLLDVIARNTVNGNINWSNVNAYFPHKAKTTLHSRYNSTLNPHINHGAPFTPEEDLLLIAAVKEYGKFSCIPRTLFPNRSLVQLRSHYNNVLSKRHICHPWSVNDDIKLMDFVTENGAKSWLECERSFGGRHSRLSCRTRYLTIKRYLEKNPDGSIENLPRKKASLNTKSVNINNWQEKVEELSAVNQKPKKKIQIKNGKEKLKTNKKAELKESRKLKVKKKNDAITEEGDKQLYVINRPNKPKIVEKKERPYIQRLRSNERKNYNFFKYAYSFEIDRHPCANIQIKDKDFAIVLAAINPDLYSFNFDSNIPKHVKENIVINSLPSPYRIIELLCPSWSTAMGFRALCINTAHISTILPAERPTEIVNNEYIRRFRERLRLIFYSTALLSRLNPSMLGIAVIQAEPVAPRTLKRKRYVRLRSKEFENKNKCVALNNVTESTL